jgi:cation diffusion facilitator CzcD-associated flavoprotein CzcO
MRARMEHLDVLVVGAGISGIGAGYYLQTECPNKRYAILEAREHLGGTWDLFRYPGIRSDSDMHTLGFSFRPWSDPKAIADGPSILKYIEDTAAEFGIDEKIRFGTKVVGASWSSPQARWTVTVEHTATGERSELTCDFLIMCSGYYRYDAGYAPEFPGRERFRGRIVHPQQWTEDIEWKDQRVVVIGSGATAVTLVPELAKQAEHVTMLQRSPTYVISRPAVDGIAERLRQRLPDRAVHEIVRWKNILVGLGFYEFSRRFPERAKGYILGQARKQLDQREIDAHFTPRYDVWDQRLCLVPDADLFEAIRDGKASVVTDEIETFTESGIRLRSGDELEADLIVTATGLRLQFLGGMELVVDGTLRHPADLLVYRGMMFADVPNLALCVGYTNASWTLKVDLTLEYVCRLLHYMDAHERRVCVPRAQGDEGREPLIDFDSGYVRRANEWLPHQGKRRPWRVYQNYVLDLLTLRHGRLRDGVMEFRS